MKKTNTLHEPIIIKESSSQPELQPKKCKLKRRYFSRSMWVISIIISVLLFIFIDKMAALTISCCLLYGSTLLNILLYYLSPRKANFSLDAYITITLSYILCFAKLVLIPMDISLSLTEDNQGTHTPINISWIIVYWFSIILNFTLMYVLITYWSQGHNSFIKRLKRTFHQLLKTLIIVGIIAALILTFLLIKYQSFDTIMTMIQIINWVYCLAHIVLLLGYGLIELPYYFFNFTNTYSKLRSSLIHITKAQEEFEMAVNKLTKDKKLLQNYCESILKKGERELTFLSVKLSSKFVGDILEEISKYNYHYNCLTRDNGEDGDLKIPTKDPNDDILADMLVKVKEHFYLCCKKEALMLRIYSQISDNCEHIENSSENHSNKEFRAKRDQVSITVDTRQISKMVKKRTSKDNKSIKIHFLIPKKYNLAIVIMSKTLSVFLFLFSLLIFVFQINLYFLRQENFIAYISTKMLQGNYYLNFFFIMIYFIYIFACCFYSLSQFKIFELYILVPHHTNKFGMAYNASMVNTLILGICYNLLYFYSFLYDKENVTGSSIYAFFDSMKKVSIVYDYYLYIFPSILIFVILITGIKKFNLFCFKWWHPAQLEETNEACESKKKEIDMVSEDFDENGSIKFEILENIEKIYTGELKEKDKNDLTTK
jgi:hypothetical protein